MNISIAGSLSISSTSTSIISFQIVIESRVKLYSVFAEKFEGVLVFAGILRTSIAEDRGGGASNYLCACRDVSGSVRSRHRKKGEEIRAGKVRH